MPTRMEMSQEGAALEGLAGAGESESERVDGERPRGGGPAGGLGALGARTGEGATERADRSPSSK